MLARGTLILDLIDPDPAPSNVNGDVPADADRPAAIVDWTDGRRIRSWATVRDQHRSLQCNDCEVTCEIVEEDGTTRRLIETFPMRLLYRYELEHLLARCGFRIVALYGDYDRSAFSDESLGMIVVAEPTGDWRGSKTDWRLSIARVAVNGTSCAYRTSAAT